MSGRMERKMNAQAAKKLRKYAQREYIDLFRGLLSMPLWDRIKIALKIVFRYG